MAGTVRPLQRCTPTVLSRVRECAPRKHDVFKVDGVTYVARRRDSGIQIHPSNFMACTYIVSGDDGSECVAEFIHIDD